MLFETLGIILLMATYTAGVLFLEAKTTDKAKPKPRKADTSDKEMQALYKQALYISNMRETAYINGGSEQ